MPAEDRIRPYSGHDKSEIPRGCTIATLVVVVVIILLGVAALVLGVLK